MATSNTPVQELIVPISEERAALEALARLLDGDTERPLRLVAEDGTEVHLPASVRRVLYAATLTLAQQRTVSVESVDPNLSFSRAATLLGAGESFVMHLVDQGELQSTFVDGERIVNLRDVLAIRRRLKQQEMDGLRELMQLSEEMGLYDHKPAT